MSDESEGTTTAPVVATAEDDLDLDEGPDELGDRPAEDDFDPPEETTESETAEEVEEPYGPLAALDALVNSYISHPEDLKRLPHIKRIVESFINNRQNIVQDIARIRTREQQFNHTELTNTYTVD